MNDTHKHTYRSYIPHLIHIYTRYQMKQIAFEN